MKILPNIEKPSGIKNSSVITIGNFDGVHLGHRKIFQRMAHIAAENHRNLTVVTFENHPLQILKPDLSIPLLTSLEHKIELFKKLQIDYLVLLPFTKEFSQQTPEAFLAKLHQAVPFSHLILGYDATLGKEKSGNQERIKNFMPLLHAEAEYVEPLAIEGQIVSSRAIRAAIQQGDLAQTEKLLGRRYSIYAPVIQGLSKGTEIGFPTLNINVNRLAIPPQGVYAIKVFYKNKLWDGVANLGTAPTIRDSKEALLEVHLFDFNQPCYHEWIDVIFYNYLRPEKKFNSIKELQEQIKKDIEKAKQELACI